MKPHTLLAIVSGILTGTSYIPFPPWAIFFCFVPLWLAWLKAESYKQILWSGWVAQFILTLIGFNWVSYTVHEFGHLPWPVAIFVLGLFCAFANLYIPLAGLVWRFASNKLHLKPAEQIVLLVLVMAGAERLYPMIFDWHFGYTWLWAGFPAYHLADMIGFFGLSTIGLFFNGILLHAWRKRSLKWAASVPAAFVLLNLLGWAHGRHSPPPTDRSFKVLVVQANIGNQEKLMGKTGWSFQDTVIARFTALTDEGLKAHPETDFIVWPETAFPEIIADPDLSGGYAARLKRQLQLWNKPLVTGGYSRHAMTGNITNSFFVISNEGQWLSPPYHKTVLLAFGEYFPGASYFPKWKEYFPQVADFGRGDGPTVLNMEQLKIGAQICYEGLFDWFTRRLANRGADVIINVTNDSWYGTWMQPWQHLYMTLSRAIEVRRPLIRSTNTGISTVVLANGDILPESPLHEEWFYLYEVPYSSQANSTLFMRWGYWFMPTLLVLGLLLLIAKGRCGRRDEKSGLG